MTKQLLLPRKCRLIGYILLPVAIIFLIACFHYNFSLPFLVVHPVKDGHAAGLFDDSSDFLFSKKFSADYTGTIAMLLTFAALFMVAFARERHEDEYVAYQRLRALQVSVYANYVILFLTALILFGFSFLLVMEINLFSILVLFIIVFNYNLHIKPRFSKSQQA